MSQIFLYIYIPAGECVFPLGPKKRREEQHSLAGEEVGGPNSEDRKESLALCILCATVLPSQPETIE